MVLDARVELHGPGMPSVAIHGLAASLSLYAPSCLLSSSEALYEDEMFPHRELAALLASKVFYHLGELADSLTYALGAGPLFDVNEDSEFVQTILCKHA